MFQFSFCFSSIHVGEHRQYCPSFHFFSHHHYYYLRASLTVAYISMLTIYCSSIHFFTLFFTFFICLSSLISLVGTTHSFPISFLFLSFVTVNMFHLCQFVTGFHLFSSLSHYSQRPLRLHLTIKIFKMRVLY